MSIRTLHPSDLHQKSAASGRNFFDSPEPAGRKITAGFTYLQRIGKAANFEVWFPSALRREVEALIAAGQSVGAAQFPAQWAAVRQFELLQESGNHKIYDLDPSNLKRTALDLSRSMRAGGYRVAVATLGTYRESGGGDDLEILDTRLQTRIGQMISMLYLDAQSGEANAKTDAMLASNAWDYREQLPHIGCALGADDLFRRQKAKSHARSRARQFFDALSLLPQKHIMHDTVIGLQLPELNGVNQWNYIAQPDETLAALNLALGDLFDNHVFHLRGYGDRLTQTHDAFYRRAALALN